MNAINRNFGHSQTIIGQPVIKSPGPRRLAWSWRTLSFRYGRYMFHVIPDRERQFRVWEWQEPPRPEGVK